MFKKLILTFAVLGVLGASGECKAAAAGGAAGPGVPIAGGPPALVWGLMACPAMIVLAALIHHQQRELTAAEAWSCGLLAIFPPLREPPPLRVKG